MKALKDIWAVMAFQFKRLPNVIQLWILVSIILAVFGGYVAMLYYLSEYHKVWGAVMFFLSFTLIMAIMAERDWD